MTPPRILRAIAFLCWLVMFAPNAAWADNMGLITWDGTIGGADPGSLVPSGIDSVGVPADYLIPAESGELVGKNLFHSFGRFGVGIDEVATFDGPLSGAAVDNILARVTGGIRSEVLGSLRTPLLQANVYLINPSGVLFGPDATLDVGSFTATTADYVLLGNGAGRFDVSDVPATMLVSSAPSAFGFIGAPAAISFLDPKGLPGLVLSVSQGNLSLVGGALTLTDTRLEASGGRIFLAAVASAGEIRFREEDGRQIVELEGFDSLADIVLGDGATLDVSDETGEAGEIEIQSRSLKMTGGSQVLAEGRTGGMIAIEVSDAITLEGEEAETLISAKGISSDPVRGGDIALTSGSLSLAGLATVDAGVAISEDPPTVGNGYAGNIVIHADGEVRLERGGQIRLEQRAGGGGEPGSLVIEAGSVVVDGAGLRPSRIESKTHAGDGAGIQITADDTVLIRGVEVEGVGTCGRDFNCTQISTLTVGDGNAGDIEIDAELVLLQDWAKLLTSTLRDGDAGDITIEAGSLIVSGGGSIDSSTTGLLNRDGARAGGQAGTIDLMAEELIHISSPVGATHIRDTPGVHSTTLWSTGDGGAIMLRAPNVVIAEGGVVINASIIGGESGGITIDADRIEIREGGVVDSSSLLGFSSPGSITLTAEESISISDERLIREQQTLVALPFGPFDFGDLLEPVLVGGVHSFNHGSGKGGDLTLAARTIEIGRGGLVSGRTFENRGDAATVSLTGRRIVLRDGGRIDTSAGDGSLGGADPATGNAGSISLIADRSIHITGREGFRQSLVASRSFSKGQGGEISLAAPLLVLSDGGKISAGTSGEGRSGAIRIDVGALRLLQGDITSGADDSHGGTIQIEADSVFARKSVIRTSGFARLGNDGNSEADAGDIHINATWIGFVDSKIAAEGQYGRGGRITIGTRTYVESADSIVTAVSTKSIDGYVEIDSYEDFGIEGLSDIADFSLQTDVLLAERCATRRGDEASSFAIRGHSGTPDTPKRLRVPHYAMDAGEEIAPAAERARARGDFDEAIRGWRAAARTLEAGDSPLAQAESLIQLAQLYEKVGALALALRALTDAEPSLADAAAARAALLAVRARVWVRQGETAPALRALDEAISLAAGSRRALRASLAVERGNVRAVGGDPGAATADYRTALVIAGDQAAVVSAIAKLNLVDSLQALGDHAGVSAALAAARDALVGLPDDHEHAFGLIHAGQSELEQGSRNAPSATQRKRAASLFYRASRIAEAQQDWLAASYALGHLGGVRESQGELDEAEKWTRQALAAAALAAAPQSLYLWHWQLARLERARGNIEQAIDAYHTANATLSKLRISAPLSAAGQGFFSEEFPSEPVVREFVDVLLERAASQDDWDKEQALLRQARDVLESFKVTEIQDYFQDACVAALASRRADLDSTTGANTAVIYPVALQDRTELLVTLPSGIARFSVPVGRAELMAEARQLRKSLPHRTSNGYLRPAQRLYSWLVAPTIDALEAESIDTLVFVPDGALRSIPLAALHDGEHFLVERFASAVAPSLYLVDPQPMDRERVKPLLVGLSESVQGYPALPYVPNELAGIHRLYGGELLFNEHFTLENIERSIAEGRPTLVHIASHAEFNGDAEESFLLTHDGRLSMGRLTQTISATRFAEEPLELLLLSACKTAAGDDRSALGLAGVAIRAGARSAVGSLWSISDRAAAKLTVGFYTELAQSQISKAAAMRNAQLSLLKSGSFAHPHYWSPFLLIGNWL